MFSKSSKWSLSEVTVDFQSNQFTHLKAIEGSFIGASSSLVLNYNYFVYHDEHQKNVETDGRKI